MSGEQKANSYGLSRNGNLIIADRGRPKQRWEDRVKEDLKFLGMKRTSNT